MVLAPAYLSSIQNLAAPMPQGRPAKAAVKGILAGFVATRGAAPVTTGPEYTKFYFHFNKKSNKTRGSEVDPLDQ